MTDAELFDEILKEEMREVPGRQNMQSSVVTQQALPVTIVRYINEKLKNQGAKNARSKSNSKKQTEE
jgi:hypothetical protein